MLHHIILPGAAVVGAGSFNAGGDPPIPASSCTLGGTITTADEDDIIAGGRTITLTLNADGWDSTLGAANAITTALIDGITSAQSEAAGWNAVVKAALTYEHVTRTSDFIATIELPACPGYAVTASETLTVTVPTSAVLYTTAAIVASPTATVTNVAETVALSGTCTDSATEGSVTAGGLTTILTVAGDQYVADDGTFAGIRQDILDGFASDNATDATDFIAEVVGNENVTSVVRTDANTVTITWSAAAAFDVTILETITHTMPASALLASSAPVVASPSFTVTPTTIALTGTAASGLTAAEVVTGSETLIFTATGDEFVATLGADNQITTDFLAAIDSAQSEATGWDAEVKANLDYTMLTRDSATQCTLVLPAAASYAITANETITATPPASSLVASTAPIVASPTMTVACRTPATINVPGDYATIQLGYNAALPGDTVLVADGTWAGVYVSASGTEDNPITLIASGSACNITSDAASHDACIYLDDVSYIIINGFNIVGDSGNCIGAHNASAGSPMLGIEVRNCDLTGSGGDEIAYFSHCYGLLVENCVIHDNQGGGKDHGIYIANAGSKDCTIQDCEFYNITGTDSQMLHVNGDSGQGGDGLITGLTVDRCVFHDGATNAINLDGVQDSLFRNLLVYNLTNGTPIRGYVIDGAAGPSGLEFVNNTLISPKWAIKLTDDVGGHTAFNNILDGSDGNICCGNVDIKSNYNIFLATAYSVNEESTTINLAAWQSATGEDANSTEETDTDVFVNVAGDVYTLATDSPAVDAGINTFNSLTAPTLDILSTSRPAATGYDCGCYEGEAEAPGAYDYYLSPSGNDGAAGTLAAPWKSFDHAFSQMSAGDILGLLDGTYSVANGCGTINASNGDADSDVPPNGTSTSNMTRVVGINGAGSVEILGTDDVASARPVYLASGKQYISIEGVKLNYGVALSSCSWIKFKDCGIRQPNQDANNHIVRADSVSYALFEDCWLWGASRMAINYTGSDHCIMRRCVMRKDDYGAAYCGGFEVYQANHMVHQNCIAVDCEYASASGGGDFVTAMQSVANDHGENEWLGCISVNSELSGFMLEDNASNDIITPTITVKNCISWNPSTLGIYIPCGGNAQAIVEHFTSYYSGSYDGIDILSGVNTSIHSCISFGSGRRCYNVDDNPDYSCANGSWTATYYNDACTTGCQTGNPTSDGSPASLTYPCRIETGSTLAGAGYDGSDVGANIIAYGTDGKFYGETGWDSEGSLADLWTGGWPNQALIRTQMRADSERGFCANGETLDHYIWNLLGNGGNPY